MTPRLTTVERLVQRSTGVAFVALGCVAAAWTMLEAPLGKFLPLAAALTLALILTARWNFGALVALLVLAVLNGIPGPDLDEFALPGSIRVSDLAVTVLVLALVRRQQVGSAHPGPLLRLTRFWGFALATWWVLTFVRSATDGVPLLKGVLFGRDFLYFAILLPLLAGAFRRRSEVVACLTLLAAASALHAAGQLAVTALDITSPLIDFVVHSDFSVAFEGTERIYASMADVVTAAFPFAVGLALIPPRRSLRLVGIGLATLTGVSILFQFTRATYLGLGLALVVISAIWLSANGVVSRPLRRAIAALAAVVVLGAFVSGFRPLAASDALPAETTAASERVASTFSELNSRTGTLGYRYDLAEEMLTLLGDRWPVGLGFLHPEARSVSSLPEGSIRNTDTGVLNAVMTMGVVGAALLYLPLMSIWIMTIREGRDLGPVARRDNWVFFGAATWILYVVVSSATLVTLFTVPGLVLTATLLACNVWLIDRSAESAADQPAALQR